MYNNILITFACLLLIINVSFSQSSSFQTFVNPVIPGDHPDPTLTKIGDYFYTSGSSFNPTPKIYRSTDLVHWEVIAQPVSPEWPVYGDNPGGGIWGGHMVLYNDTYWHYFGRGGGNMYFVTADDPGGPWSNPTQVQVPSGLWSLGVDNSIFIDDDTGKWYLLTKAGHSNNHLVELGLNGQPTGVVLDLTWLNPTSEGHPYGWAEGPVMWKYDGHYYYSFAEHLVGVQYVMKSDTLTDDPEAWTIMSGGMFQGPRGSFDRPNHISPAVLLDDGTSWAIGHSYHTGDWYAQGRQGLLHRIIYDEDGWPRIQYPTDNAEEAPNLPGGGIPWMVPKSDMFNDTNLHPEWSFLGSTPLNTVSLTERPGWLYMEPRAGVSNTIIKNDGEHQYSLITRVDFDPLSSNEEAGLWIFNGPQIHYAKVFSTVNNEGKNVLAFSFQETRYEAENTIGSVVFLKLVRDGHIMSGYYSADGYHWTQIGEPINAVEMGREVTQFNDFTGNQQGLYVMGKPAFFNFYIYRDAYSDIGAQYPVNRFGVQRFTNYLGGINNDDWALYAGVEFGIKDEGADYRKNPVEINVVASSATSGGVVEVWLDSIETGRKIAEVTVENTGDWNTYETFTDTVAEVSGRHDVYLRFKGAQGEQLFRLRSFKFTSEDFTVSVDDRDTDGYPFTFSLEQNYPNPFNSMTHIRFSVPSSSDVTLKVYDIMGREVVTLVDTEQPAGVYDIEFSVGASQRFTPASGVYFYRLEAGNYTATKKMLLLR
jgi:xylan 1,4-beta-xylosidase